MKYLTISLLLIIIAGCNSNFNTFSNGEEKISVVHQYIEAIAKRDVEAMEKLLADNYITYGPALKTSVNKAQNISDWKKLWEERIVSMKYKRIHSGQVNIEKSQMEGDWVSEWGEVTMLYKDGNTVKFWFNGLYKVDGGLITEARIVYDNMDILTQLGYKFMPPSDIVDEAGH